VLLKIRMLLHTKPVCFDMLGPLDVNDDNKDSVTADLMRVS